MEEHVVKILQTGPVTHNVKFFRLEKPSGYSYKPGQATDVTVNIPEFRDEKRPFTFTSLTSSSYLEFVIKRYPEHKGVTDAIHKLRIGDELILHEVFGEINYKGEGTFIAGGAGVTPFISILRNLSASGRKDRNMLIFANRSSADIILEKEFQAMEGLKFINILSDEKNERYFSGLISEEFLHKVNVAFEKNFYVCGPPPMMDMVIPMLRKAGVDESRIVQEGM